MCPTALYYITKTVFSNARLLLFSHNSEVWTQCNNNEPTTLHILCSKTCCQPFPGRFTGCNSCLELMFLGSNWHWSVSLRNTTLHRERVQSEAESSRPQSQSGGCCPTASQENTTHSSADTWPDDETQSVLLTCLCIVSSLFGSHVALYVYIFLWLLCASSRLFMSVCVSWPSVCHYVHLLIHYISVQHKPVGGSEPCRPKESTLISNSSSGYPALFTTFK